MIKLYNKKKNIYIDIDYDKKTIIMELYYNLSVIPSEEQYKILYPKMKNKDIIEHIDKIKNFISTYNKIIPLYNPYDKNILLIKYNDVFNMVVNNNYRVVDNTIKNKLNNIINKLDNLDEEYLKKLKNNINFINNYNIDILHNIYKNILYETNPIFKEITQCERISYLLYQYDYKGNNINPYYSINELTCLKKIYNITDDNDMCETIKNYEMDSKNLLYHQIYLTYNRAKSYIQYYSLLGSYLFNNYLRNCDDYYKDIELEKNIINFYKIIDKSPSFDINYKLFRYIENDDYLKHLKINDIYLEGSFISTTRNPFINLYNDNHDIYLIIINIPKNKEGVGLSIEAYSLFKHEMEIILNPSKLKLTNIKIKNKNIIFNHMNDNISKKIKKIYEFEYIDKNNIINKLSNYKKLKPYIIPKINFYDLDKLLFSSNTTEDIINEFVNMIPKLNNRRIFKTYINNSEYEFDINFVIDNEIYNNFFFLENKNNFTQKNYNKQIYLTYINSITGSIELLIEIKHIISVNYIHRFNGNDSKITDNDLLKFISHLSYHFKIDEVIIHSKYNSYALINKNNKIYNIDYINNMDKITENYINLYIADTTYFSIDFINYIENNIKRFNELSIEHKTKYYLIDRIMNLNPFDIIIEDKSDILYQILKDNKFKNIKDLYLYLHYNQPLIIKKLIDILNIYKKNEKIKLDYPLTKPLYIFKPFEYLYQYKFIKYIPILKNDLDYIYNEYNTETKQFFRINEKEISL